VSDWTVVVLPAVLVAGVVLIVLGVTAPERPRRAHPLGPRLTEWLVQAGVAGASPWHLIAFCSALASLAAVVLLALSGSAWIALAFAVLAGYLPVLALRARHRRRTRELQEVWPDAIDNLASGVRAGLSLPEAVAGLADRGPEPLRPSFARFAVEYHATGRFGVALDTLKDELADPTADRVVEALRLARDGGGTELGRTLRTLANFLRDSYLPRAQGTGSQADLGGRGRSPGLRDLLGGAAHAVQQAGGGGCVPPARRDDRVVRRARAVGPAQGAVRAVAVVMLGVLSQHRPQLPAADDQHPVQQLPPDGAHPSLGGGVGLGAEELPPGHRRPCGRWFDAGPADDGPDGAGPDHGAEAAQLAVDAPVAPGRVLPGQPQHERPNLSRHSWAAMPVRVAPTASDQIAVPAQQCFGPDEQPVPGRSGQQPRESSKHGLVGPVDPRPAHLAP
jgi:tight adherence protein B